MQANKENFARSSASSTASSVFRTGLVPGASTANLLNDTQQRINATASLTYRPSAMSKSSVASRSHLGGSASSVSASDTRDLLKELDTLRRELDRKETRNANLTAELQGLRTSFSTQQREVRMLSGTFEKINADRQRLSNELVQCKEYKDKLEVQLTRLGDVHHLASHTERLQSDKEQLEMEVGNFRSLLAARDDRIKALERDLEVFHRSLEVQAQYEGSMFSRSTNGGMASSSSASVGGGRETLKSLYYELGKRQTDAHSLAISLASSNQELVGIRDSLREAVEARAEALADLDNMRAHCSHLTQQSVRDKDELASLHDKHNNIKSLAQRLQAQVEDLSRRLAEERLGTEKERSDRERLVVENGEALQRAQQEAKSLRGRVEALQTSLSQADSVRTLTEKRLASEWAKLSSEMEAMADKSRRYDLIEGQLEATRHKLADAQAAKEEALATVRALGDGEALQMHNSALTLEVDQANARVEELLRDKAQSVAALQQTMDAARELSARLQAEKTRRASLEDRLAAAEERAAKAEQVAEGVNKAREHVSTAVLDALHKERVKTAALERSLQELTQGGSGLSVVPPAVPSAGSQVSLPPPPPPPQSLTTAAGPVPAGAGGTNSSKTISYELMRLRNEIARMEASAPTNLSGISADSD